MQKVNKRSLHVKNTNISKYTINYKLLFNNVLNIKKKTISSK